MRICSPQLGLAPKSILGGEVFDREILIGLAKKEIKIEIILPKGKPHDRYIKNWRITYLTLSHFPAFLGNIIFLPYLFSLYRKGKFQILRIHQPQFLGFAAVLFKFFNPTVKLVATYHQFRESNFWAFSKLINNLWDHIICDSQNVKDRLVKSYQINQKKITVVHNGVPKYLRPASKNKQLITELKLNGKIILLFMGLFNDRKNPLFLLDVLSLLTKTRSDFVLIFWGKGPLEDQINIMADKMGVKDNIRILKPLFGKEKNKIHNLADIFIHPSIDEGFALSPLEAMACAKPIVMTQGYSSQEAVADGINGFLCFSNDPNHWSQKLEKLIEDRSLREKLGKASLTKVKKEFQWSLAINKHVEVFKKLTDETI